MDRLYAKKSSSLYIECYNYLFPAGVNIGNLFEHQTTIIMFGEELSQTRIGVAIHFGGGGVIVFKESVAVLATTESRNFEIDNIYIYINYSREQSIMFCSLRLYRFP